MVDTISSLAWKRITPGTHVVELPNNYVYIVTREGVGDWQVILRVGKKEQQIASAKLLWLGKCRAEQHYAALEVKPPPIDELAKKLPRKGKAPDPDKAPLGEGPRRKTPSAAARTRTRATKAERPPPNTAITLQLDNQDREDDVLVTAAGEGADLWARRQGSLSGSRWEVADGQLPYVVVPDSPGLVREIGQQVPGVKIDQASYVPPAAPAAPAAPSEPAPTKLSSQALDWTREKGGKRDVHVASHEGVDFKILRVAGTDGYALFKQQGDDVQEVACADLDECKAKAQELAAKGGRKRAAKAKGVKEAAGGKEAGSCGCAKPGDKGATKEPARPAPAAEPAAAAAMDERTKVSIAMSALTDLLGSIPPPAQQ